MRLFHFMPEKYVLEVVREQCLKLATFSDLNDPFELNAVELSSKQLRDKLKAFKRDMAREYGVLCFSKTRKNPLLWSHYANRHKGVALELEVLDNVAHPIVYRKNRYALDVAKLKGKSIRLGARDIAALWLTKYVQWEYEEEVRMIVRKSDCNERGDFYFYKLGNDIRLEGLVLGPLCEIPVEEIGNHLPRNTKVSVTKSRLAFRSFEIVRRQNFKTVHLTGK